MAQDCCKQNTQQTAGIGCFGVLIIGLMIFFVGRWSQAPIVEQVESLSAQVASLEAQVTDLRSTLDETRLEVRAAMTTR
ncbi:MAG: hypothetical protein Tsb0013_11970 [Phycisphaerales bacterium]